MKKFITAAAFLAASTALASATTVVFDSFFGTAGTETAATFASKIFNDKWKPGENPDLFSDTITNFEPVYNFGISRNSAGTLYYDNNNNSSVVSGNQPTITVNADGSADLNVTRAAKGITFATYWNTLSTSDLASVSDLTISFTGGTNCNTLQLAVFYLASGGGADNVQRLVLENSFVNGTAYSYQLTDIATGAEATGGTLVLAVLNNASEYTQNSILSNIVISGTAIPEPSAFGLLAGAGALALVAARRRRRSRKA